MKLKQFGIGEKGDYLIFNITPDEIKTIKEGMLKGSNEGVIYRKYAFQEFIFIINFIKFRAAIKKHNCLNELKQFITKNDTDFLMPIKQLVEWNLITLGKYLNNVYSREVFTTTTSKNSYSIKKEIFEDWFTKIDKKINREIYKWNWFEGVHFEDTSRNYIDAMLEAWKTKKKKEGEEVTDEKLKEAMASIDKVIEGDYSGFKKYNKEQRLYHTFSSVPSTFRSHLFDARNIQMIETDIKNSHPRLLSKCFIDRFIDGLFEGENKDNLDFNKNKFVAFYNHEELPGQYPGLDYQTIRNLLMLDLSSFEVCASNDFYLKISKVINQSIKDTKSLWSKYINDYHHNEKISYEEIEFWMKRNYKTLSIFIRWLHSVERALNKNNYKKEMYSIPYNLSSYESDLVLGACKRFRLLYKEINIISIHDSIIIPIDYKDKLKELVKDEYRKKDIPLVLADKFIEDDFFDSLNALNNSFDDSFNNTSITPFNSFDDSSNNSLITPFNNPLITNNKKEEQKAGEEAIYTHNVPLFAQLFDLSLPNQALIPTKSDSLSLPKLKSRNRESNIKIDSRGRYTCSYKNKQYNSRKGETYDDFRARMSHIDNYFK